MLTVNLFLCLFVYFFFAQDLHKVIIGPPTIDFGEVCLRSTNQKQLRVINNLNQYIHVQVSNANCKM